MNSTSETQFDSRMNWLTASRMAGLIVVFLFALYPGVILGTESFFFRDFGLFTYPFAYYAHESFWRGEIPLWNPLNNCGIPFLAQWNTTVCYPPSLIYMIFPLPWSLNYFLLGHLALAGTGMFLLARHWTQNCTAAGVAAFAFALNGLMLNHLMSTGNLAALSWQPFVILWAGAAWQTGGTRKIIIAAFAGAMQMLAGSPEIILFTWAIVGALCLAHVWTEKKLLAPALRRLLAIIVLITALSAVQLLPFLDCLKYSQRDVTYETASGSAMPIWGWANFIIPFFHDIKTPFGTFLQPRQVWTCSYYVGIGTLVLAIVAAWQLRRRVVVCILAATAFVGLILALGDAGQIYSWIKHVVPWIGFARFPIKFVAIPVFAIPLLAAFGLNHLQNTISGNSKRAERALFFSTTFLLLSLIGILAVAKWALDPDVFDWRATWRDGAIRAFFLVAVVVAIAAFNRVSSFRLRDLIGFTILALAAFDVATAGLYVSPTVVTKAFGPLELNMTSHPKYGSSRAMISEQVASYLYFGWTTNALYYVVGFRGSLFENGNIAENIPKVDGFWPIRLKEQDEISAILYNGQTNGPPAPLLDFLGVSQISASNSMFAWQERKTFLPLITGGQRPVFESATETLKQIGSDGFDPRHVVYLSPEARKEITATNFSPTEISDTKFAMQRLEFKVEALSPSMVVIAQSFYHDWHAYIDGKSAHLWRANDAFQAIEVPAGNHEIVLRYEDWAFRIGAIISAMTLAGCLAGLFLAAKKQRRGN